jgi:membrane protease subunit HflK
VYLPLDRLLAQSTANEAARGAGSGPVMVPPQNPAQPAQQPQAQSQQPQTSSATQPDAASGESPRTRELRSRDTGRERESR